MATTFAMRYAKRAGPYHSQAGLPPRLRKSAAQLITRGVDIRAIGSSVQ